MKRTEHQPPDAASGRFAALWEQYAPRVHAYARRHVDQDTAQEIASETFLIAWRRLEYVPGDPLPWLLVVARNTIFNQRRSAYRRRSLEADLTRVAHLMSESASPDVVIGEREWMLTALAELSAREREALFLTGWDGLAPAEAAQVAGCTVTAFKMRLSRARARFERSAAADTSMTHAPNLESSGSLT